MENKKTAVFISGQHLDAPGWDEVMWAEPEKGRYGRIAKGLVETLKWDASLIVFGTGASVRNGVIEADYIFNFAKERIRELPEFAEIQDPESWLEERAVRETTSQNTEEEVLAAARIALSQNIERILLVSSPTHIERVLKVALSICLREPEMHRYTRELYATSSHTPYAGFTVDDVVIIEPPHRGDKPNVPFHATAKQIFQFQKDTDVAKGFNDDWQALIDEWKKKLL